MRIDATAARFPSLGDGDGAYESFYVKAHRPDGSLGVWIRYTVLKAPGRAPTGSLWFTLFRAGGPVASKVTHASEPRTGDGAWIGIGDARFGPDGIAGAARTAQLDASWDLRFDGGDAPLYHLPTEWMYRAKLPRTKLVSPLPRARFEGTVRAGDETIDVDGWPGMVGHNWGAEHAERWIWLHGTDFAGHPASWLDVALGRVKLGPATTPWIANGVLCLDGTQYRLGGLERVRSTRVTQRYDRCEATLPGKGVTVRVAAGAPSERFVAWRYAHPGGGEHHALNCSIADMTVTVVRPGRPDLTMRVAGGATYEQGVREHDHGVPVQPFGEEPGG